MTPLLFDASALIALFEVHPRVYRAWDAAPKQGRAVLLPSTAIAVANHQLNATDNAWEPILHDDRVLVLDLTATTALGTSRYPGGLAVAHASFEAAATGAVIVTATPSMYPNELDTYGF